MLLIRTFLVMPAFFFFFRQIMINDALSACGFSGARMSDGVKKI